MGNLFVVTASTLIIAGAALLLHKPVYSLIVGVLVGAVYFLIALARGGGIAEARITRSPGEARKPTDPAMATGIGLVIAGAAAPYMMNSDPNLSLSIHNWYRVLFAAGLLVALWFAGKTLWTKRQASPLIDYDQDDGKI